MNISLITAAYLADCNRSWTVFSHAGKALKCVRGVSSSFCTTPPSFDRGSGIIAALGLSDAGIESYSSLRSADGFRTGADALSLRRAGFECPIGQPSQAKAKAGNAGWIFGGASLAVAAIAAIAVFATRRRKLPVSDDNLLSYT